METSYVPVDPEMRLDCSEAVARLPERERLAMALVYGSAMAEEAAQVLGVARARGASLWKAGRSSRASSPRDRKELER